MIPASINKSVSMGFAELYRFKASKLHGLLHSVYPKAFMSSLATIVGHVRCGSLEAHRCCS